MQDIIIPAGERSPEVLFRFRDNLFSLRGECYPEDAAAFFGPLLRDLAAHLDTLQGAHIRVDFHLVYFNTSSAKGLMNLIRLLEASASRGNRVEVRWHYQEEDDVMQEFGEDFSRDIVHADFCLQRI